jgi:hypothetical protein
MIKAHVAARADGMRKGGGIDKQKIAGTSDICPGKKNAPQMNADGR